VCFDILKNCDFGFVHQVLTYSRRDNESILSRAWELGLLHFSRLSLVYAHGRDYLSQAEYEKCLADAERRYFLYLTRCALRGRKREFWEFHRKGLASMGYKLDWRLFSKWTPRAVVEKLWESFWASWDGDLSITPGEITAPPSSR